MIGASVGIAVAPDDAQRRRRAAEERRPGAVPRQGEGARHLPLLRAGHGRAACRRAAGCELDLRKALSQRRVRALLPAARRPASADEICGFEALLRWHHPERGSDLAGRCSSRVAEETGLIVPIGEWVLAAGLRRCRHLARPHQGRRQPVAGAVQEAAIWSQIGACERLPLRACRRARLELEITEVGAAAEQRRDARRRCISCGRSACASPWTISAPAIPR